MHGLYVNFSTELKILSAGGIAEVLCATSNLGNIHF